MGGRARERTSGRARERESKRASERKSVLAGWQRIRQPIKKKQNEAIKQTRIFGHHESSGTSILGCAKWLVLKNRCSIR